MSITQYELDSLSANIEEQAYLRSVLKERVKVFDVEAKEYAAKTNNVSLDTYYHLSFDDWMVVKKIHEQRQEEAFQACIAAGIPSKMPFNKFPLFLELMNLENGK